MTDAPAVRLTPRLAAAAAPVRIDRVICDVGTDHALLPCFLFQRGARRLIASDVRKGPLQSAMRNIRKYGAEDCIRVVLSDGLKNIEYAEDIIIAGMGGELISRIISECDFFDTNTRLILQPMTRAEKLRRAVYAAGFELLSENCVREGDKYYTVMYAGYTGKPAEISELFSYVGKVTDNAYLARQADILENAARGCTVSDPERAKRLTELADGVRQVRQHNESQGSLHIFE